MSDYDALPMADDYDALPKKKKEEPPPSKPRSAWQKVNDALAYGVDAVTEPVMAMATGAVAKPLSDVAGLAAIPLHAAGLTTTDPTAVKQAVQDTLTYAPRSESGKSKYNPLNMIPHAVGSAVETVGEGTGNFFSKITDDPVYADMIKNGVKEGVMQVPQLLGGGFGPRAGVATRGALQGENSLVGARSWMQSALKPSQLARESGDAGRAYTMMLETDPALASIGTTRRYSGNVDTLQQIVNDALRNSTERVSPWDVVDRLNPEMARASRSALPLERMREVMRSGDEWTATHPHDIPVQLAQEIKQETGREVRQRGGYGEIADQQRTQNLKGLTRGLKEVIEEKHPEVTLPNRAASEYINARDLIEDALGRSGNQSRVGWGSVNPSAVATRIAGHSALVRSLVAHALHNAGKAAPTAGVLAVPGSMAATQAAETEDDKRERERLARLLKRN